MEVLGIVFGIHFCPHSIIPVTWYPGYPRPDATIIHTMCAIKVGTIYFPIHQVPTAAVKDTADLLIEHRKLTLPLRPWKIVFPPRALLFSQSRGERLVIKGKGPWEGYRRQAPVVSFPPSFARTFSSRERDVWVRGSETCLLRKALDDCTR